MPAGVPAVSAGIGFAGIKGFGGGFDVFRLNPFGEEAFHAFVAETVREAALLDEALAHLEEAAAGKPRLVVMHYAPTVTTVLGEPEPLYPFLGSSRLSEPLERHGVRAAFHGHAHAGTLSGHAGRVAVFNVAYPVLVRQEHPRPFFLYTV